MKVTAFGEILPVEIKLCFSGFTLSCLSQQKLQLPAVPTEIVLMPIYAGHLSGIVTIQLRMEF